MPKRKYEIDPFTIEKRKKRYGQGYKDLILTMQKRRHINGVKLVARVRKGMQRIENKFSKLGKEEIALRQALFFIRQTSLLTDAAVDAMHGIEKFEAKSLKERNDIWHQEYSNAVEAMINFPEISKVPKLKKYIDGLHKYFVIPEGIYKARKRHWNMIKKIEDKIKHNGLTPSQNFQAEIERIINKSKVGQNTRVKAMDVCVAASIYADVMEKKGGSWAIHYRSAMEIAYDRLKHDHGIFDAIIELK